MSTRHKFFSNTATSEPPATARDAVLGFLNGTPRGVGEVCAGTGLDEPSAATALMALQCEGIARQVGDGWVKQVPNQAPAPLPEPAPVSPPADVSAELAEMRAMFQQVLAQSAAKDAEIAALRQGATVEPAKPQAPVAPPFGEHVVNVTAEGKVYNFHKELRRFEADGSVYVVGLESLKPPKKGKQDPKPTTGISVRHIFWHEKESRWALDQRGIFWTSVAKLRNQAWRDAITAAIEEAANLVVA